MEYTLKITEYFERLKKTIDTIPKADVNELMVILIKAKDEDRTVFVMGNGGSASTASHYCCDFNKGISYGQDKMFKFIALNDNIPTMMAYANDLGYDQIFVGPLRNFMKQGDIVIGISGSGNSMNVVNALEYANEKGGFTIGLTGYDGGKVKKMCKHNVHIPIDDMQITEDLHLVIDHCIMSILYNETAK